MILPGLAQRADRAASRAIGIAGMMQGAPDAARLVEHLLFQVASLCQTMRDQIHRSFEADDSAGPGAACGSRSSRAIGIAGMMQGAPDAARLVEHSLFQVARLRWFFAGRVHAVVTIDG